MAHCFVTMTYKQGRTQFIDSIPTLQYIQKFAQELNSEYLYYLLTYISAYIGNPSQETYAAAALICKLYLRSSS